MRATTVRGGLLLCVLLASGCVGVGGPQAAPDPLPSWRDGASKERVLAFIDAVTTATGADYVPPSERIAVFDNDGTLWSEKPLYFPVAYVIDRVREVAPEHPDWSGNPAVAAVAGGARALSTLSTADLFGLAALVDTGMNQEENRRLAEVWLTSARHPIRNRPYESLVYQPMLELLAYLRDHEFKTFIVTGGFVDFTRVLAERVYDIPPEQVIGTRWKLEYRESQGGSEVMRLPELESANDRTVKVTNIEAIIGRRPLLAVGNSDGDMAMLTYTDDRPGASLELIVHHDDAGREYDYDEGAEAVLERARERDWVVISVSSDFERVYPEQ